MKNINEATSPPNIKQNDPGLLTRSQYLNMRNTSGKMHPDDAYQSNVKKLNYGMRDVDTSYNQKTSIFGIPASMSDMIYINPNFDDTFRVIIYSTDNGKHGTIIGVIYNGVAKYSPEYLSSQNQTERLEEYDFVKSIQPTKYPQRIYQEMVQKLAVIENKQHYKNPFSRIKLKGKYFTLHEEKGDFGTIAAMNEEGLIVASAQNEWGTTLIMVAEEYKGYGLGPRLASIHIDKYNLESGGYTQDGIKNASKIWNNRVQEYIRNGWYSELIKNGTMKREQVRKILDDFKKNTSKSSLPDASSNANNDAKESLLLFVDEDRVSAVLYDIKFLEEQIEDYIYAAYHIGGNADSDGNEYIFSFEYDNENHKRIILYTALQIAKDDGYKIDAKREGTAYIPYEDMKNIEVETEGRKVLISLEKDVMDVNKIQKYEKSIRGKVDQYDEIYYQLVEMAESKYRVGDK